MTNLLRLGLLALITAISAMPARPDGPARLTFQLNVGLALGRYGLLVASPDEVACGAVRFVVSDVDGVVGQSQALQPGEVQVVRIGSYAAGDHALTIAASGCPVAPAAVRWVRLGKSSPDHGARAAAVLQARFAP
jgi:hypothetical protein